MTDVSTASDMEGVEDVKEVVNVGVKSGVTAEIEMIGVDATGADEVVEDDFVAAGEVRKYALPC